jgi:hypothetical protein
MAQPRSGHGHPRGLPDPAEGAGAAGLKREAAASRCSVELVAARSGSPGRGRLLRPGRRLRRRDGRRRRLVRRRPLLRRGRGRSSGSRRRLARLPRPHGGRRPARGRDGARPGLGRRRRRTHLRPPGRPQRQGDRARHDRRDAGPRPRQRARGPGLAIKGYIEDIPLADASVDVVISNCVINLSADKRKVLAEAARVLRRAAASPSRT